MDDKHRTIQDLIERSSFGTPEAREIRALTPLATRLEILAGLENPNGKTVVFVVPERRRRWPLWPRKFLR